MTKFICATGPMRSGTTLLYQILCNSPDAGNAKPELTSIRALCESFRTSRVSDPNITESEKKIIYGDAINQTLEVFANKQGSPKFAIFKDPLILSHVPIFQSLCPLIPVICSIRDPRAIASSVMRVRNKLRAQNVKSFIAAKDDHQILEYVFELFNSVAHIKKSPGIVIVSYEDIASKNTSTLEMLETAVGYKLSYGLPNSTQGFDPTNAFYSPLYGRQISSERVHDWSLVPPHLMEKFVAKISPVCAILGLNLDGTNL